MFFHYLKEKKKRKKVPVPRLYGFFALLQALPSFVVAAAAVFVALQYRSKPVVGAAARRRERRKHTHARKLVYALKLFPSLSVSLLCQRFGTDSSPSPAPRPFPPSPLSLTHAAVISFIENARSIYNKEAGKREALDSLNKLSAETKVNSQTPIISRLLSLAASSLCVLIVNYFRPHYSTKEDRGGRPAGMHLLKHAS